MRGEKLKNIYVIESKEYQIIELTSEQLVYLESILDRNKYNNLRNEVLKNHGDYIVGVVKIHLPENVMVVYNEMGIIIN
jgi:hypothetical protein